jgi:3-oxoadipate enol-lactonase
MPIIDTGEARLNCRWDGPGQGPALVLANSLGAALDMWWPQVGPFSAHLRVLRYDTRGHGLSSVPPGPYSLEQLATDVLRLLDAHGIERAHFCGLSMGGTVGMWLGAHAPDRIDRLVLSNTSPYFGPPDAMNARIAAVRQRGMGAIVDGVIERWFTAAFRAAEPDTVQRIRQGLLATSPEGYVACCAALRDLDLRDSLARIRAPTLVITGSDDPSSPPGASLALAAAIPGARCIELPAAHLANLGAAAAFNASVLGFLGGT